MSVADLERYEFSQVPDLEALCELVHARHQAPGGVALLAGGTDFMVTIGQSTSVADPLPLVIDVSRLADLRRIGWDGKTLRIGAAVTYLELQRHSVVCERAPAIARMTYDVGGPTIQARGTLGGNLATASPAADGVAAVAAYDPIIELASVRGSRSISIASFQTGYKTSARAPDEVIVAVVLSPPPAGSPWMWRKVGTRAAQAISKVALAATAERANGVIVRAGVAMASVAPVTALMPATRALMRGFHPRDVDVALLDRAVESDVSPIDDLRSTRAYRMHCAKALMREWLRELSSA